MILVTQYQRYVAPDTFEHSSLTPFKDYANPITRFAMQDYPVDGGSGMSQLQNAGKITSDLAGSVVSPAARVDGVIYFVDELLQLQSGDFFLPERFFQGEPQLVKSRSSEFQRSTWCGKEYELYALGRQVALSDVCNSSLAGLCLLTSCITQVRFQGCDFREVLRLYIGIQIQL